MNWPGKCFKNISGKKEEDGRRETASSSIPVFLIVEKAAAVNDDTQLDILKAIEKKSMEQSFKPCRYN